MKQYTIKYASSYIFDSAVERLNAQVKRSLANGWKIAGGVAVANHNGQYTLTQAMIKESK